MPYCSKCGKRLYDDAIFCSYCGTKLLPSNEINAARDYIKPEDIYCTAPREEKHSYRSAAPATAVIAAAPQPVQPMCSSAPVKRNKTGIVISVISLIVFFALLLFAFWLLMAPGRTGMSNKMLPSSQVSGGSAKSGNILAFESSGIKIYFCCWKGATKNSSPGVEILVKNNCGKEITVKVSDVELDGCSLNGILYENLSNGEEKTTTVFFKKDDLEAAGITAPSTVQMKFVVLEKDSGNPVCSSEILRVKTK